MAMVVIHVIHEAFPSMDALNPLFRAFDWNSRQGIRGREQRVHRRARATSMNDTHTVLMAAVLAMVYFIMVDQVSGAALQQVAKADVEESPIQLSVHRLFRSGAVLQQGMPLVIWGEAPDQAQVTVSIQNHRVQTCAEKGRWKLILPALEPGGPWVLTISTHDQILQFDDILVGEVWLCAGQSNMGFPLKQSHDGAAAIAGANDASLRFFKVPFVAANQPQPLDTGDWIVVTPESAGGLSAVAYHFARVLRQHRQVPVGIIVAQLGGTQIQAWMSTPLLKRQFPWLLKSWENTQQSLAKQYPHLPNPGAVQRHSGSFTKLNDLELRHFKGTGRLFNGMIAPLLPYAIRGVVWYQGESDQGQAWNYRRWLPALIRDWREHFEQPDLPFLIVMLPGFGRADQGFTYELRDAQFHTIRTVPHTYLANAVDLGDEREVHPPQKQLVGERLARLARAEVYGESITPTGPLYRQTIFESSKAIVYFDHLGEGLEQRGPTLSGFMLAGADEVFHPAAATIEGDTVVVHTQAVPNPVAVRYAWTNTPRLTLWSKQGLPAAPFRSDDFVLRTHWDVHRK